jgi:hypothetical protein
MRDSVNIKNITLLNGYSYQGLYLTEYNELYIKLAHSSGITLNIQAHKLKNYIL